MEHEWQGREPRMEKAFRCSVCRARPSLSEAELGRVGRHASVLYCLSANYPSAEAARTCHAMLRLGAGLLEAGGWAVKCESSGIAHSRERWLELAREADEGLQAARPGAEEQRLEGRLGFWGACYRALVQLPIRAEGDLFTCGMHLLGQADLIVSEGVVNDPMAAVALFDALALYLLAECAEGGFQSGHTFGVAEDAPRYRVTWEECTGYDADDFLHNPFGRWRLAGAE